MASSNRLDVDAPHENNCGRPIHLQKMHFQFVVINVLLLTRLMFTYKLVAMLISLIHPPNGRLSFSLALSLSRSLVRVLYDFIALDGVHIKLTMININRGWIVFYYHVLVPFTSICQLEPMLNEFHLLFVTTCSQLPLVNPFVWDHIQVELNWSYM